MLPTDPFQRCAYKAVVLNAYGHLPEWKRVAYIRGMEVGASKRRVWCTSFFPSEGFPRGATTASGYGCSERVAASNRLPRYSFVWANGQIRQVLDTGTKSNDRRAERLGASAWCDFWEAREGSLFGDENGGVRTVYCISRRPR